MDSSTTIGTPQLPTVQLTVMAKPSCFVIVQKFEHPRSGDIDIIPRRYRLAIAAGTADQC